jgi:hypothetical protein
LYVLRLSVYFWARFGAQHHYKENRLKAVFIH